MNFSQMDALEYKKKENNNIAEVDLQTNLSNSNKYFVLWSSVYYSLLCEMTVKVFNY